MRSKPDPEDQPERTAHHDCAILCNVHCTMLHNTKHRDSSVNIPLSPDQHHYSDEAKWRIGGIGRSDALPAGVPKVTTDKLQRVMNAAPRVITGTHKFDRGLSAHWNALAQCARVSDVLALHHGAQLPARSSAAVLGQGRPLPTSLRRRFSTAYQVRQSTTPGTSAWPVANVRLTGFLCFWPVGLELIAWQFERSECHQRQLPQTFEKTVVRSVLKHPAH